MAFQEERLACWHLEEQTAKKVKTGRGREESGVARLESMPVTKLKGKG